MCQSVRTVVQKEGGADKININRRLRSQPLVDFLGDEHRAVGEHFLQSKLK